MNRQFGWLCLTALAIAVPGAGQTPAQSVNYDPKAAELMREVERATLAVKTLAANVTVVRAVSGKSQTSSGTARLMRPNYARLEIRGKLGQTVAANGKQLWVYNASTNQFVTRRTESDGKSLSPTFGPLIPLAMFFNPATLTSTAPPGTRIRLEPGVVRNGVEMRVIALFSPQMDVRLFIGPDHLVHRSTAVANRGAGTIDVELTSIKRDQPMSAASFSYTLPKGASEMPGSIDVKVSPPSGKQNRR